MRKLSVPYTIVRGGVYYLNLRWNNQFIRQSLATKVSSNESIENNIETRIRNKFIIDR
jgi:hypothetical protein